MKKNRTVTVTVNEKLQFKLLNQRESDEKKAVSYFLCMMFSELNRNISARPGSIGLGPDIINLWPADFCPLGFVQLLWQWSAR